MVFRMKSDDQAARAFAALGNPTRLAVLRLLVRAGNNGLNVTEIRDTLEVPASTLAHHLQMLATTGLVDQTRVGRELVSTADYDTIRALTGFLLDDCCAGVFRKRSSG